MIPSMPRLPYWAGWALASLFAATALLGLCVPGFYDPYLARYGLDFAQVATQDIASLVMAPLLAVAVLASARGSPRAQVVWGGSAIYGAYYYSFYCMDKLYSWAYPLYLAILTLSVWSLVILVARLGHSPAFALPPRSVLRVGVGVLFLPLLFVPLWGAMLYQDLRAQVVSPTATVFLLDLCFLIPASAWAAWGLLKNKEGVAYPAAILLFKAGLSGIILPGGTLFRAAQGKGLPWIELGLYLLLALLGGGTSIAQLAALGPAPRSGEDR